MTVHGSIRGIRLSFLSFIDADNMIRRVLGKSQEGKTEKRDATMTTETMTLVMVGDDGQG